jgi:ubiquinone biosynthesis protein UbiJ
MKKDTAFIIGCTIAIGVLRVITYKFDEKNRKETEAAMRRTEEIMRDWKPKVTFEAIENNQEETERLEDEIRRTQKRTKRLLEEFGE